MSDYPGAALDAANAAQVYWQTRAEKAESERDRKLRMLLAKMGIECSCHPADDDSGHCMSAQVESALRHAREVVADRDRWKNLANAGRGDTARVARVRALLTRWQDGAESWGTCSHEWMSLAALQEALDGDQGSGLLDEDGGA